jgi:hypothetical protein
MGMDLGVLVDMANGVISMRPRISRRARRLLQLASGSERQRLLEVVRQASQVLASEFERQALPSERHQRLQAQRSAFEKAHRRLQDRLLSLRAASKSFWAALRSMPRQLLQRAATGFKTALQRFLQHLRSPQVRAKLNSLAQVFWLTLRLLLEATLNGLIKAWRQLAGRIKERHLKPGLIKLRHLARSAINRLHQLLGQIKQALRRVGRKQHRS